MFSNEEKDQILTDLLRVQLNFAGARIGLSKIMSTICSTYSINEELLESGFMIRGRHINRSIDCLEKDQIDDLKVSVKDFFTHENLCLETIIGQYFFDTFKARPNLRVMPINAFVESMHTLFSNIRTLMSEDFSIEIEDIGDLSVNYYSENYRKLRLEVMMEQGEVCVKCSAIPSPGVSMTIDHIKPVSKYPELFLDKSNMQVLCFKCNRKKSNHHETDYRKGQ